jgi:capsular polysaccharide transport system permease protein
VKFRELSSVRGFVEGTRIHVRVILALILRDMRTRYGRSYWTYVVAIGWPLSHLAGIVIGFVVVSRALPLLGTDSVLYIATGALPYILFMYPARMAAQAIMAGRGVIFFPIVRPIDLMMARIILETLNACLVCIIFCGVLWMLDLDIIPEDVPKALTAVYATIFFGISMGLVGTTIVAVLRLPGYMMLIMFMIVLYLGSGVHIPVIGASPERLFWYDMNPLFHLVTWLRSAYFYEAYSPITLNKSYVVMLSFVLFAAGLLGERIFRGKVLM